jgi:DNA-binding CsgD family transcriptional regulator
MLTSMNATEVELTPYQERVLDGIADGLTYKQIADRLGLKPRTVKAHVDLLRRKFAVDGVQVPTGRALIPIAQDWFAERAEQ